MECKRRSETARRIRCQRRAALHELSYFATTGKNTQVIKEYIRNQLKKDRENMQLSIDYPEDPFTGSEQ